MGNVYIVNSDGRSEPMSKIRCKDEEKEIQNILENNLDLLPGDQIDPDDPRRWLLVKREMSVQDPNTGQDRWSIDFFLVDQDGIPTFVECKRFADTRSRREVIGQVLEYAANGHYYWTAEIIKTYAEEACRKRNTGLDKALEELGTNVEETPDQFFSRVEQNLREGQVRIVLFLEESPFELRSVVDFLNKQMERSEVIIVEARQYATNDIKIVVPVLFGYTEQARLVKRPIVITSQRRKWDKLSFFNDARSKLKNSDVDILSSFLDKCISIGLEIGWGTGGKTGSYTVYDRSICPRSFYTVGSNGTLSINFGWLNGSEAAESARDRLLELVNTKVGLPAKDITKFPTYELHLWKEKIDSLVEVLKDTIAEISKDKK